MIRYLTLVNRMSKIVNALTWKCCPVLKLLRKQVRQLFFGRRLAVGVCD
jgi:metal-sulfur cluster biosynthetic enzyme